MTRALLMLGLMKAFPNQLREIAVSRTDDERRWDVRVGTEVKGEVWAEKDTLSAVCNTGGIMPKYRFVDALCKSADLVRYGLFVHEEEDQRFGQYGMKRMGFEPGADQGHIFYYRQPQSVDDNA